MWRRCEAADLAVAQGVVDESDEVAGCGGDTDVASTALPDLIASLPDQIRGFGPVKDNARAKAGARRRELLAALDQPPVVAMAAE